MNKTIELDCAPGTPRPDTYIKGVVEGTAIEGMVKEPQSKLFGNWVWGFDVSDEVWIEVQRIIAPRIKNLYYKNKIRYGSW